MTLITNLIETKLSVAVTVSETGSFFCFYDTATHDSVSSELDQYQQFCMTVIMKWPG